MKHPAAVAFVRALGAVHAAVGTAIVFSGTRAQTAAALLAAAATYHLNRRLELVPEPKDVLVRGYLAPLAGPAVVYVAVLAAPSWEASGGALRDFLAAVVTGTPAFGYLAAAAVACFAAHRKPRPF